MTDEDLRKFVRDVAEETKGNIVVSDFAVAVARKAANAATEACVKHLKDAATRLAPDGKRTNQYDRHMADVLNQKADELLLRSNAPVE